MAGANLGGRAATRLVSTRHAIGAHNDPRWFRPDHRGLGRIAGSHRRCGELVSAYPPVLEVGGRKAVALSPRGPLAAHWLRRHLLRAFPWRCSELLCRVTRYSGACGSVFGTDQRLSRAATRSRARRGDAATVPAYTGVL